MNTTTQDDKENKTTLQRIIGKTIDSRFIIWLSNTRLIAFIIQAFLPKILERHVGTEKVSTPRTIMIDSDDELDNSLRNIAHSVVHDLGYVAAMVAPYEQGDVLPARVFYIDPEIATLDTIKDWEKEVGKYSSKPVSITNPEIARVYRYREEDKDNLSIRAIEAGKPLETDEIYELFIPVAPKASRHLVNTIQKTLGINKLMAVPFFSEVFIDGALHKEVVGNLFVATKKNTFDQKEKNILNALGKQAAVAIEGIQRRRRELVVRKLILTMQSNLYNENILLQEIAESVVEEFGYIGSMVATYEKGDVLPARAFYVDPSIATLDQIHRWEKEIEKLSSHPVSITNPEVAKVYRYREEDRDNLSIRAIEAGGPLTSDEIYDLFTPIAPEASREFINAIQQSLGIQKVIAIPFFFEREKDGKVVKDVLGNLFVATQSKSFTVGEIELFKELGQQAAAGIRNARILRYANNRKEAAQNFAKMAFTATAYLHELRNHIGAFKLHLQLLQMFLDDSSIEKLLELDRAEKENLEKNSSRNKELLKRLDRVKEILDTLREPWKRVEEKPTNLDKCLNRAMDKVLSSPKSITGIDGKKLQTIQLVCELRYQVGTETVTINKNISSDLPVLRVSPDMLIEAFRVMIKNAVDAVIEGSNEKRIWIESFVSSRSITILIRDNGVGIAPDNIDSVFEYGWSTSKVGMGFGLYWTKDFIEGLGGNISVESNLKVGTTFTIELPMTVEDSIITVAH